MRRNLHLLDPALPPRTARRVYAEFGKTLADYFHIGTRPPAEAAVRSSRKTSGREHLEEAHDRGKGALIVTGPSRPLRAGRTAHGPKRIPERGADLPEPSGALTAWRAAFRRRWNVETIEIGTDSFRFPGNRREIARRLFRRHADRPAPSPGQHAGPAAPRHGPFLDRHSSARRAWRHAPVIPATMVRAADGPITRGFSPRSSSRNGPAAPRRSILQPTDRRYSSPRRLRPSRTMVPIRAVSRHESHSARPRFLVSRRV